MSYILSDDNITTWVKGIIVYLTLTENEYLEEKIIQAIREKKPELLEEEKWIN